MGSDEHTFVPASCKDFRGDHDRSRRRAEPGGTAPGTRAASWRVRGRPQGGERRGGDDDPRRGGGRCRQVDAAAGAHARGRGRHGPARPWGRARAGVPVRRRPSAPGAAHARPGRCLARAGRAGALGVRPFAAGRRRHVLRPPAGPVLACGQPRGAARADRPRRRRRPPRRRAEPALPALPRAPAGRARRRAAAGEPAVGGGRAPARARGHARRPARAHPRRRPALRRRDGALPRAGLARGHAPGGRLPRVDPPATR